MCVKEFDDENRAFMHLYVEVSSEGFQYGLTRDIITEHLAIYFRYIDSDYKDLNPCWVLNPCRLRLSPQERSTDMWRFLGKDRVK